MDRSLPLEHAPTFADRLNYLFATRLSPHGRPYTLREAHEGTGRQLSISYLSLLRKGGVEMPTHDKVRALADFFEVDIGYFSGRSLLPEQAMSTMDDELSRALAKPGVREFALRASEYGEEERALVLEMLDRARQLAAHARERRRAEPAASDGVPAARSKEDDDDTSRENVAAGPGDLRASRSRPAL